MQKIKLDPEARDFFEALRKDLAGLMSRMSTAWARRPRRWRVYAVSAIFPILGLLLVLGGRVLYGDTGWVHYQELRREFQLIKPFPGAVEAKRSDSFSRWRPLQTFVDGGYNTTASYAELRRYYDPQLDSRGWRFVEEHPIRDWGSDVGAWEALYCKGDLAASLDYGPRVNWGFTYSFALSWGLHRECQAK